ncbi:MAG: RNA degradosome polyphosphate kinase [Rickettsiales bacterium]|nr:RNA degradosome polyphosphate kinase [Rickettsiales bacterium]
MNRSSLPEDRYFNRELSWLAFNARVLEEAENPYTPLLERVNFLSICGSNLDEFVMVRVAGLMDQQLYGIQSISIDGMTPKQQLKGMRTGIAEIMQQQQQCWIQLRGELSKQGVDVITKDALSKAELNWLAEYFSENIFPVLTPIAIDPAHPFPFIPNLGIAQLFTLETPNGRDTQTSVILFPPKLQRFVTLADPDDDDETIRMIPVEEVIALFIDKLFPKFKMLNSGIIRVIRDSDLDIEDDAEDLVGGFERAIKRRRRGRAVRINTTKDTPQELRQLVMEQLQVEERDIVALEDMVGLSHLSELLQIERPECRYPPFTVRFPERIEDYDGNCFAAIAEKDIVVHHPYESFDVVVRFVQQAALDPDVISIKSTLYRTSSNSPIVAALIEAAENGKSVTALVELKARFDEEANIRWARDMERAGVQVVYGFVKLKTHSKVTLVTRKDETGLKSYAHFGTGNYHPKTAKVYTDLSFFTCNETLCRDAAYLFNFVTGYAPPRDMKKLVLAPKELRPHLLTLIKNEIVHATEGRPAFIWAKMNALLDPEIIDALYIASQAGVTINLVVRGICSLKPSVKGLSENITVKSIVGRFLEHSRIYAFGDGHTLPSEEAKLYISSADWMPRNFDRRVEVLVPIENETVHAQILGQIMLANFKDEKQSWMLGEDGIYTRMPYKKKGLSAHEYFMTNPSLSGRGKVLQKAKSASGDIYKLNG